MMARNIILSMFLVLFVAGCATTMGHHSGTVSQPEFEELLSLSGPRLESELRGVLCRYTGLSDPDDDGFREIAGIDLYKHMFYYGEHFRSALLALKNDSDAHVVDASLSLLRAIDHPADRDAAWMKSDKDSLPIKSVSSESLDIAIEDALTTGLDIKQKSDRTITGKLIDKGGTRAVVSVEVSNVGYQLLFRKEIDQWILTSISVSWCR